LDNFRKSHKKSAHCMHWFVCGAWTKKWQAHCVTPRPDWLIDSLSVYITAKQP
jgi:hypothetical protein